MVRIKKSNMKIEEVHFKSIKVYSVELISQIEMSSSTDSMDFWTGC